MGFYSDVVVPYCIEFSCGMKALAPEREKVTAGLEGRVLEIGFGSGLNLPFLGHVSELLAVDPSERARKIGKKRIDGAPCPAPGRTSSHVSSLPPRNSQVTCESDPSVHR